MVDMDSLVLLIFSTNISDWYGLSLSWFNRLKSSRKEFEFCTNGITKGARNCAFFRLNARKTDYDLIVRNIYHMAVVAHRGIDFHQPVKEYFVQAEIAHHPV